jgi:hypothetical protein
MTRFKLKANLEFDAENIDDALKRLARHLLCIKNDRPSDFISNGEIDVAPKKVKNERK